MAAEIFWILLVIALGVWLLRRSNNKNNSNNLVDTSTAVNKLEKTTKQPDFFAKIQNHSTDITKTIKNEIDVYENELNKKFSDDLEKKKRLSKFAQDNKLDEALIAIWNEIKYYPNWSNSEDFQSRNKLMISDCIGSKESKNNEKIEIVQFIWEKKPYEIKYIEKKIYLPDDNETNAYFILSEENEEVFSIKTRINYNDYGNSYNCFDISCFKKQGEWYRFLLNSFKVITIQKEKWRVESKYYGAGKIKNNFKD